ncbi:MAG: amidohydrolase family protein [Planctomycetaceae bacterium]|nr:amidohydrolase family protein [Planctomycetaceae bacterium]
MTTSLTAYRARWIVPVDARPIANGVLVVSGDRIVRVADQWPGPMTDLGDVALIPGLVNCHTHLEFSALTEPLSPGLPFTDWIRRVIRYRQEQPGIVPQAIQKGLSESLAGGVTLLGDIASTGWTWADYTNAAMRPRCVVFQELLGLSDERVAAQIELAKQHSSANQPFDIVGLSPHAPYSVHPELLGAALIEAQARSTSIAVHLAETAAERELLADASGEFREFLSSLGLWREGIFGERTFADWLHALAELPRALVIHGNYLNQSELAMLARSPHVTMVYCPRTHAAFGHPPHPWQDLIAIGGTVAIGTDSRATNPDLSLWRELQFLAAMHPDMPQHDLLKLGTLTGAKALGCGSQCGSLTPGKRADVAAVSLADPASCDPVYQLLNTGNEIAGTMLAGRWVCGRFARREEAQG